MEMQFKPLVEKNFSSPKAFARFSNSKKKFSTWHKSSNHLGYGALENLPVFRTINKEADRRLRGRMAAELIHDQNVPALSKMQIASHYFFVKPSSNGQDMHAVVPSAETYVEILKAKKSGAMNSDDMPYELRDSSKLRKRLEGDLGRMTLDDQRSILQLERDHNTSGVLSSFSRDILIEQLKQRFDAASMETDVNDIADQMQKMAELSDYRSVAGALENSIRNLPNPYGNDQKQRVNNAKNSRYKDILDNGFRHYMREPRGNSLAEQKLNFPDQVEALVSLMGSHKDTFLNQPDKHLKASEQLKRYEADLRYNMSENSRSNNEPTNEGVLGRRVAYAFEKLVKHTTDSVSHSVKNRTIDPSAGAIILMETRLLHKKSRDDAGIGGQVADLLKFANDDQALKIHKIYLGRIPALVEGNPDEAHGTWLIRQDAMKRLSTKNDMSHLQRSHMMDAVIDLDKTNKSHDGVKIHADLIGMFKELPVDDKKMFLGKMLEQDYPEQTSSELITFAKVAKDTNDPVLLRGACLVAAKAMLNSAAPENSKSGRQNSRQDLSQLYAIIAGKSDRKEMRKMVREHGEDIGLTPNDMNDVLQSMRGRYKSENNIFARGQQTVRELFAGNVNVTKELIQEPAAKIAASNRLIFEIKP